MRIKYVKIIYTIIKLCKSNIKKFNYTANIWDPESKIEVFYSKTNLLELNFLSDPINTQEHNSNTNLVLNYPNTVQCYPILNSLSNNIQNQQIIYQLKAHEMANTLIHLYQSKSVTDDLKNARKIWPNLRLMNLPNLEEF